MPKFSAYMRGEEGPQGNVGQAVLLNGIVSSSSELPPNTENQKNLVYYVGNNEEDYHLYVYTTTEEQWQDLGNIIGPKGSDGPAAGFSPNQNSEIYAVDPEAEPQISIIPDSESPDTAKVFNFTFGIPRGQNAGFSTNQNIEIESVNSTQEMYASVSTDENSPNTAKVFNFKFGIPRGESADFGEPTASISTISSFSTASVSVSSSGSATSKIFDFHFDIPQGLKGDRGDSFSIYEPLSFTTGTGFWVNTTTFVYPRGDNSKLPIYIYNEDTDELDNSFIFTSTEIIYNSEQPFNGSIYLMAPSNRPSITIGEVSTTSYEGQMSVSLNELSTSSDAVIDFTLASGPNGEAGGFGEVTSTAELIPSSSTYIEKDSVVSFSTDYDINDVTVDIEPVQDLHGYDHPWPAGGGKNLLDEDNAEIGTAWNGASNSARARLVIPCKSNTTYTISMNGTLSVSNIYRISSSTIPASSAGVEITNLFPNTFTTGSDSAYIIIAFSKTDITKADIIAMKLQLEEGSTTTDYTPYSNICPISGWTGMNVQRTGKNLLPFSLQDIKTINSGGTAIWNDNILSINNLTFKINNDGSVEVNGTASANTSLYYINKNNIDTAFYNGKILNGCPLNGSSGTYYIRISDTIVTSNSDYGYGTTIDIEETGKVRVSIDIKSGTSCNNLIFKPMIRLASDSDDTYESYLGTTYPISWSTQAGTVYGGNLDVTTGVLTVNRASVTFENLTFNTQWATDGNITTAYAFLPYQGKNNTDDYRTSINAITNFSKWYPYDTSYKGLPSLWSIRNNNEYPTAFTVANLYSNPTTRIVIKDNQCSTIAEYREKYNNSNYYVVYELAEPLIYQLTPTQITALLGQNNIWADTGDVQVSYNKFNQPYVEITTDEDSPNTAKRFNFHFGIPQGEKGAPGDAFSIYEPLSFTTGSSYWMENILAVPRGDNNKLPLFIYNRDNNNIAATFKLENDYIIHEADSPFNGTLYMMSQTNRSTLRIGNVSTTTYGNGSSFSLNEASTSTDAIFDVVLEQGPKGETALTAQVGRVSYTSGIPKVEIEGEQNLIFNFDLPRGFKGDKGDTFTVDVNNTIDVLNYNETPIVETTSTSTGIALKFKLPPSVSAQLGDLSQYNSISLTTNLITGVLPVNKGGTGANQLTTNAVILGNNTSAVKQKATANGAFFATGTNKEPGFGILPIAQGGTGTTTAAAAWTALGGGESGKHPDSYFALASHGTHVSYGTTVTAIGTASAGTASTVSRSDHVHNISVTTGDANGQVKIAGTNIAVKGLKSAAYTESSAYAAASHTHSYLPLSGGTLTGQLTLSADGYKTSSTIGYATDQHGNFIHQSANNTNYFYIGGADGTSGKFSVYFDTGNVTMTGGLTIGGGSQITKVTFTNVDPGANSNLPTGNIVFVYE